MDVFAAEEYDPLHLNAHRPGPLKAVTKKLADPLLHLQDKHTEEEVCIALREFYIYRDEFNHISCIETEIFYFLMLGHLLVRASICACGRSGRRRSMTPDFLKISHQDTESDLLQK